MNDTLQKAVTRVLAPLVRLLLRHGVSHAEFANWAKQAYVSEAGNSFSLNDKRPSVSRIAIITGINRKEVKRVMDLPAEVNTGVSKHNRAVRVITGWLQDSDYHDGDGKPKLLTYADAEGSFNRLVRQHGGDVPPRAMLDELLRVGTVTETDGQVRLEHSGYVPHRSETALLDIFATSAYDLLTTLENNLSGEHKGRLQMSVAYDNVTSTGHERFRKLGTERAMAMLRDLDKELSQYDREANPAAEGDGRFRTGLGVYLIEEPLELGTQPGEPDGTDV